MKTLLALLLLGLTALALPCQAGNVTILTMNLDIANGIVAPAGPSRVRVPPGESVRLVLPPEWPAAIQWRKNGQPISGATNATLVLGNVTTADSGLYTVTGAPFPTIACGIQLEVVAVGTTGNFSSRLRLQPGSDTQIIGFVVTGTATKTLLIRAVGPTLATFGVAGPAAQPRIAFFDSKGQPYSWARAAVVLPPEYWTGLFASVGAFPLTGGEEAYLAFDVGPFPPGAYTIHVTDASKAGGTVLVEAYEVP
ncbi:MAG TPA: immunoglobulin domain-containing protein [Opitutaceae bacterium]|nr:immunoglobulin domain-containing protein [Opitutaceae bacterium]HND61021.1 immunoglobulin domain-containing protein [Opitutaceae bacterium]